MLLNSNTTLYQLFRYVNLNIDAEVTVVIPTITGWYDVYDVYNSAFERGGQLKISKIGFYNSSGFSFTRQESKYMLRRNFDGVKFKTVVVVNSCFVFVLYRVCTINIFDKKCNRFLAQNSDMA